MNFDKFSDDKIFNANPKEDIIYWVNNLKYFNLLKARPGHNCEGDKFAIYISYTSFEDLIVKLKQLDVDLISLGEEEIAFDPFADISIEKLDKIRYVIPEYNTYIQPQNCEFKNIPLYIWVQNNLIEISLSGGDGKNSYAISNLDFENCKVMETVLERLCWLQDINTQIKERAHCISLEKYPEYRYS